MRVINEGGAVNSSFFIYMNLLRADRRIFCRSLILVLINRRKEALIYSEIVPHKIFRLPGAHLHRFSTVRQSAGHAMPF